MRRIIVLAILIAAFLLVMKYINNSNVQKTVEQKDQVTKSEPVKTADGEVKNDQTEVKKDVVSEVKEEIQEVKKDVVSEVKEGFQDVKKDVRVEVEKHKVEISDAYARPVAAGANSAIYFTIKNSGPEVVLVGVKFKDADDTKNKICESLEMHKSFIDQGVAKMAQVDKVLVPASQNTEFAPGGLHIMMMNSKELKQGDKFDIELMFDENSSNTGVKFHKTVKVEVLNK